MVAKITVPSSIKRVLNYNEQKFKNGVAECLYAHRFLQTAEALNYHQKLSRFEDLITLNRRAKTNAVHISLNFAEGEKIEGQTLTKIACHYMKKIGFDSQPYLVYQHLDAGHPHLHIVTTNIGAKGKRISLHNLGRVQSEKARKEIENTFKLTEAEEGWKVKDEAINPASVQRATYGKTPTKKAITFVLEGVLSLYKCSSLDQLNAVLKRYNVVADRGKEDGIIFKNRGLVYRMLDERGNGIGVHIKASSINKSATLAALEKKFAENEGLKQPFKKRLQTSLDWIQVRPPKTLERFIQALAKEKISLVTRQNDAGAVYGLIYIDHNTKCVFNGGEISKEYSAKAILGKLACTPPLSILPSRGEAALRVQKHTEEIPRNKKQTDPWKPLQELITPRQQGETYPIHPAAAKRKNGNHFKYKTQAMQTGENEQGLRKILDLTRMISIAVLLLHFYYYCYGAFAAWGWHAGFTDYLLQNIARTGLFRSFQTSKAIALVVLSISLLGARGRKDEKLGFKTAFAYILTGMLLYFGSYFLWLIKGALFTVAIAYMLVTVSGFILVLTGGTLLSKIIQHRLTNNVFNAENETFPQEERLLSNEYSVNLPAQYNLKGKVRNSWINIINPFRGVIVMGSPGSGKSYFVIRHIITQHIRKGFTLFLYDFKYDDLTKIAYNTVQNHAGAYAVKPQFYVINFDDLSRSHRCNPLHPEAMVDIADAAESARSILLSLNREWIKKQGDFWVESAVSFLTAIIWFFAKISERQILYVAACH